MHTAARLLRCLLMVCLVLTLPAHARAQAAPASVQTTFSYGPYTLVGTLPPGLQLAADVPPDAVSKRWDYLGEPGPDGIRPVVQIGLYQGPPAGVTFTLQDFANSMTNGLRMSYGDFIGQFSAPASDRLHLSWSGLLRRQNDIVPVRGILVVGLVNGGFFRLDAYDSAVRAVQSMPTIERAFATFAVARPPAPAPAPTREQLWATCSESKDLDASIAACTTLTLSGDETVVNKSIAFFNRGNSYRDTGDRQRAIADFGEAIRLDPMHHQAWNNRGLIYSDLGQNDPAIRDFSEAIRLDPGGVARYYNRGLAQFNKDENLLALADFEQVIRLTPGDADAHYMRGAIHYELRNDPLAIQSFDAALRLNPRHVLTLFYRAAMYYQVGDMARVLQDIEALLAVEPMHARGLYVRGLARRRSGATEAGNADMAAAIRLNPNVAAEVAERGVQ